MSFGIEWEGFLVGLDVLTGDEIDEILGKLSLEQGGVATEDARRGKEREGENEKGKGASEGREGMDIDKEEEDRALRREEESESRGLRTGNEVIRGFSSEVRSRDAVLAEQVQEKAESLIELGSQLLLIEEIHRNPAGVLPIEEEERLKRMVFREGLDYHHKDGSAVTFETVGGFLPDVKERIKREIEVFRAQLEELQKEQYARRIAGLGQEDERRVEAREKEQGAEIEKNEVKSKEQVLKEDYVRLAALGWTDGAIAGDLLKRNYDEEDVKRVIAQYSRDASDESDKATVYAREVVKEAREGVEEFNRDLNSKEISLLETMAAHVRGVAGKEPKENVEAYIQRTESLLKAPDKVNPGRKEKSACLEYQVLMKDYLKQTGAREIGFSADVAVAKKMYELGYTEKEVVKAITLKSPKAVCCSVEFKRGDYEPKVGKEGKRGIEFAKKEKGEDMGIPL